MYYKLQTMYIPLLRCDLLCDRVSLVPTCPVFTGPANGPRARVYISGQITSALDATNMYHV